MKHEFDRTAMEIEMAVALMDSLNSSTMPEPIKDFEGRPVSFQSFAHDESDSFEGAIGVYNRVIECAKAAVAGEIQAMEGFNNPYSAMLYDVADAVAGFMLNSFARKDFHFTNLDLDEIRALAIDEVAKVQEGFKAAPTAGQDEDKAQALFNLFESVVEEHLDALRDELAGTQGESERDPEEIADNIGHYEAALDQAKKIMGIGGTK